MLIQNNDLFRTISSKFRLELSNDDDDDNLISVQSILDLKKIEDTANHIVTVESVEIVLNNLNKDQREMADILTSISKIQHLDVHNLSI